MSEDGRVVPAATDAQGQVIRSGEWAGWVGVADYRAVELGETLVERLVWNHSAVPQRWAGWPAIGPGFVWYRFWLAPQEQIVEKYFDADGDVVGTVAKVTTTPVVTEAGRWASDLLLSIRISPTGRVVVANEEAYETAVAGGKIGPSAAQQAEQRVRALTAATAQGRFPPPLVRNWKVDIKQIQEGLRQ